jgi:anaerobic ribonucleoside-triphosphate reductase
MTQSVTATKPRFTQQDQEAQRTKCEVWTRVMGYHRPVQNFNVGKKSEHYNRTHFSENVSANSSFCKKYSITN